MLYCWLYSGCTQEQSTLDTISVPMKSTDWLATTFSFLLLDFWMWDHSEGFIGVTLVPAALAALYLTEAPDPLNTSGLSKLLKTHLCLSDISCITGAAKIQALKGEQRRKKRLKMNIQTSNIRHQILKWAQCSSCLCYAASLLQIHERCTIIGAQSHQSYLSCPQC